MTGKMINQQTPCKSCTQMHSCREVYRQLGNTEVPLALSKIIAAFLLPILVFITSLAVFGPISAKITAAKQLQIALGFLPALAVTFLCILIIKLITQKAK